MGIHEIYNKLSIRQKHLSDRFAHTFVFFIRIKITEARKQIKDCVKFRPYHYLPHIVIASSVKVPFSDAAA